MGLGLAKCLKTGKKTSGTAFFGYLGPAPNQNALTYKKVLCFIDNRIHIMNFVFLRWFWINFSSNRILKQHI